MYKKSLRENRLRTSESEVLRRSRHIALLLIVYRLDVCTEMSVCVEKATNKQRYMQNSQGMYAKLRKSFFYCCHSIFMSACGIESHIEHISMAHFSLFAAFPKHIYFSAFSFRTKRTSHCSFRVPLPFLHLRIRRWHETQSRALRKKTQPNCQHNKIDIFGA